MDQKGIRYVIAFTAIMASIPGIFFFAIGAWPIVGLLGLDVAVLWWAMSTSLKSGDAFEEVTLWAHELEIRHVTAKGKEHQHKFNPFYVRFRVLRDYEDRVTNLILSVRRQELEIGTFLTPDDKASFAQVFGAALVDARR